MTRRIVHPVSLLSGLALVFSAGVMLAPGAVQAKDSTTTQSPAPAKPVSTTTPASSGAALVEQLKLTDKQKKDIANIRRERTVAINKVLTPDQKAKFEAGRKARKSTSEIMGSLNLKPDQKTKIQAAIKKSQDDIVGLLTPDQKKTLADYMKQKKGSVE